MPSHHTYKGAGVDIDTANQLVKEIGKSAKATHNADVLEGLGGFASLYNMPKGYKDPVLVSCTDGVGTKIKLALEHDGLTSIGQDLVAMCVNDLLATGARPLFFLDYYASGQLNLEDAKCVVSGIAKACSMSGCALVGGETAELPNMYQNRDFDLAGFCVGVVERDALIGAKRVCDGDQLIGITSSGVHSNGYSLIHQLLSDVSGQADFKPYAGIDSYAQLIKTLLEPTFIYPEILQCLREGFAFPKSIHAVAHITGGGLAENLTRILPHGACATITYPQNLWPPIFQWIQKTGAIADEEMRRVFNCGVGMVLCVAPDDSATIIDALNDQHGAGMASHLGTVSIGDAQVAPKVMLSK